MPNESPRTDHYYLPPSRGKRRDGFCGFMTALAAVLLGIALSTGPMIYWRMGERLVRDT